MRSEVSAKVRVQFVQFVVFYVVIPCSLVGGCSHSSPTPPSFMYLPLHKGKGVICMVSHLEDHNLKCVGEFTNFFV